MLKLKKTLEELGVNLESRFSNLNWGGCGVVALLTGKALQSRGVPVCGALYTRDRGDPPSIPTILANLGHSRMQNKQNWVEQGISFAHILLQVNTKTPFLFDSEGVYDLDKPFSGLKRVEGDLSLDVLEILVEEEDGWNICFNRANIPQIDATIKLFLKSKERALH